MALDSKTLKEEYVDKSLEDMDFETMEQLIRELLTENLDGMTDTDLIELVNNSAYPELIEEHTIVNIKERG